MSTPHSSKRKRAESVGLSAESSKRTRPTAKSASKPSEPSVTPRTLRSKQQSTVNPSEQNELVVEERVISLRSKEITTPIQGRTRRQQTAVTGDSSAADSDNDAWEGMDVEESSVSGSEMSTPAKRLYGRKSTLASAGALPAGNRRSLPAVVSARRAQIDDFANIDDESTSEAGSVASRRLSRRASYAGSGVSRATGRGATSGAGSTALALLSATGSQADVGRDVTGSSSAGAGSRARRAKATSATVTGAAAQGSAERNAAQRMAPAPPSSSSSSSGLMRQTIALPASVPAADLVRQPGQPRHVHTEEEEEEEEEGERGLAGRWRSYLGMLLVLLVSAAVAYCLAGAASSVVSVHPAPPGPRRAPSAVGDHAGAAHRHIPTVPPSPARDVDVEALLQRVDAGIRAHLASIRAAQSVADTLQERAGKVNASLVAALDRQAAVTADTELHLHGLLRDLDYLQGNATAFTASVSAHLNDTAGLASLLATGDASAATALAEKMEGELAANISSARARSEELVGLFSSELRALAERTGTLTSRRAAQTGLSAMEAEMLPPQAPLTTAHASQLLAQAQRASTALAAHAEVGRAAVESDLPEVVDGLRTAVNSTADRLEEAHGRRKQDGAIYAEQQWAAIEEARAEAGAAAEMAQAEVDAAVAEAVTAAQARAVAAAVSDPIAPQPTVRDEHLGPEESDERIGHLAEELLSERSRQKRSEATDRFETDVAAQTEAILRAAEDDLQAELQRESQLEVLLHRTGYSHSNLGLESFKEALWEVDQGEEGQEEEEESVEGERELQGGGGGAEAGIGLERFRGQLARMHDFAVGVRGGRALHHRALCHAGGGLLLTSPPASSAADGASSLTSALLGPFRGIWGGSSGSTKREDRGARRSPASTRGSQRRIAALPVTTVVSHTRPFADSYYAMAHSSSSTGSARAMSRRSARSHREAAFDYALSVKEALAQVTVALHAPVNVTVLRVVHATADSNSDPPACAPATVRVLGWTDDPSKVRHLAGKVLDLGILELGESVACNAYPAAGEGRKDSHVWERAALPPALVAGLSLPPLRAVTLQVLETEGQAGFTCLHRLQVVGAMVV